MSKKGRVLVAMSGGIDSSIASVMLHEQGYEVIGLTMKTWEYAQSGCKSGCKKKETGCCSLESINDARRIAVKLGFPHMVLDIREEFGDYVINHFTNEYLAGRTPNPCILCNTHIKWEALLRRANQLDCQYIATGHYAKIRQRNERYFIAKSKDRNKDQSYALWGISQENLRRTILPLQEFTKPEVRDFARSRDFKPLLNKSESYEICFIPDNDYRGFLKRQLPGLEDLVAGGNFILEDNTVVGKHAGYPFYTVGQRKGLGIALGYPVYVTEIRKETNEVVLGTLNELIRDGLCANQLNMMKYATIAKPMEVEIKIRYHDPGTPGVIRQDGDIIKAFFGKGVYAIAPGQAAVFYEEDDIVCGGWIQRSFQGKDEDCASTKP